MQRIQLLLDHGNILLACSMYQFSEMSNHFSRQCFNATIIINNHRAIFTESKVARMWITVKAFQIKNFLANGTKQTTSQSISGFEWPGAGSFDTFTKFLA